MASSSIEESFSKLFLTISDHEKSLDNLRRILNENINFDPYSLFKFLDHNSKRFINEKDIMKLLKVHNILLSPLEAKIFITFYDADLDNQLSFREFMNVIMTDNDPKNKETSNFIQGTSQIKVDYDTEYSFVRIIEKEISLAKIINSIMKNLIYRSDFSLVDIFSQLDFQNLNYLSPNNFKIFLQQNELNPQDSEVKAILKRFDIDKDGKVFFWEFKRILSLNCKKLIKIAIEDRSRIMLNNKDEENVSSSNEIVYNNLSTIHQKSVINDSTKLTNLSHLNKSPQYLKKSAVSLKNDTKFFTETYNKSFFTRNTKSIIQKEFIALEEWSFMEFLKDLIDIENDLENLRCALSRKEDFSLYDIYKVFEVNNKGNLTVIDLKYTLNLLEVLAENDELSLLIREFSVENNKKRDCLSYHEWCLVFTPHSEEDQKLLKNRTSSNSNKLNKYEIFSPKTKIAFQDLMTKLIYSVKANEKFRVKLNLLQGFNIREIFNKLDRYQKNYLIYDDLLFYFKRNNVEVSRKSLDLLYRRFDKDKDGRISYHEFTEEIFPKSNDFLK